MPPTLAQTPRWRYWAARAAAATGSADTARGLYVSLLSADNYYSAMAAARLDQSLTPNPAPLAADEPELARIAALPAFVRARELLLAGMRTEALAEWQHGVRGLAPAVQPQVVHLGMRWQWYDVSIATATQQRIFDDYALLYPRPYDADVRTAVASSGLSTELVYGVLRQESLYRPDAISSAGAVGLLQMLPETARRTARRAQHPLPRPADLLDTAINVRLGAAHLKELVDQFGGQVPLALAGYNAGPGAALRWLPEQPMDTDVWIENIPFNETRNYVQRILWHTVVFSWLGSGQPQVTHPWLTEVSRSSWAGRATAGEQGRAAVTTPALAASTATPQ
jgi:soluble lytic murein transglycosylase